MYLLLSPVILLLLAPLAMIAIRMARPSFAYTWLTGIFSSLLTLGILIWAGFQLPLSATLPIWANLKSVPAPSLLLDPVSWPFGIALVILNTTIILTSSVRSPTQLLSGNWKAWAATLILAGLGLFGVMAGEPLGLLMAWTAMDFIELFIWLLNINDNLERQRAVAVFGSRAVSSLLLLWGWISSGQTGVPFSFQALPANTALFFLLAAGLRLGLFPLHLPFISGKDLRRGQGTMLKLAPTASSIVLLIRISTVRFPAGLSPYLIVIAAIISLYGAIAWLIAKNELEGAPFWLLSLASMALAATLTGQSAASQAWGLSLLFSGGLLFLFSIRTQKLLVLPALGLLVMSGLPLLPSSPTAELYAHAGIFPAILLLSAQALILSGYIRHSLRPGQPLPVAERWMQVVYPFGLALLPAGYILSAWVAKPGLHFPSTLAGWAGGLLAVGLAAAFLIESPRLPGISPETVSDIKQFFSFSWLFQSFSVGYRMVGTMISWLTIILEGDGGVLWAFVVLALLLAMIAAGVGAGVGG